MAASEKPRATRPFRLWDENGSLSVKMYNDAVGDTVDHLLWPTQAVESLLTCWGYTMEEGWLEIDSALWHHISILYDFFDADLNGHPSPFKGQAALALGENRHSGVSDEELTRLVEESTAEEVDNSRWMADYTLKWLELGLRLLAATRVP